MWVRGLKHVEWVYQQKACVAPYVGAWIETNPILFKRGR